MVLEGSDASFANPQILFDITGFGSLLAILRWTSSVVLGNVRISLPLLPDVLVGGETKE